MTIGAHVSIAKSFDLCIDRATEMGANCLQTFASSPRSLKFTPLDPGIIEKYLEKKHQANMGQHFFHGVYLVNLATEKQDSLEISINSLIYYQELAGRIQGEGTIFHVGSHKGAGFEEVKDQVISALEKVLARTPDKVMLYLENAAGHKGTIGSDFKELATLIEGITSTELQEKIAVCVDTQHAFVSGNDLRTQEGLESLLKEIDSTVGLEKVRVIHANDSKTEFNSHRDRHENIGEGEIGSNGFQQIVNHPKLKNLPFILEVPGDGKSGPREQDIETLRNLSQLVA